MDAKKRRFDRAAALDLAAKASDVYSAKGKSVVHLKLSDRPSADELAAALLGPSGNLRAPAALVGRSLLVGFSSELYAEHLR